jgi:diaminopimelate epimerase
VRAIPFAKAHGLGNDFLILRAAEAHGCDLSELALRLCERHSGLGADGMVVLGPSPEAAASFRIFNSDGSEASLSGNALRCAAAWLLQSSGQQPLTGQIIQLDSRVGRRTLHFVERAHGRWVFRAEIGAPSFRASDIPFRPRPESGVPAEPIVEFPLPVGDETVRATILHMGNPQCIVFVEDLDTTDWLGLGAELERHPWFPDRANIGFVRLLSADRLQARFWERGAGHTLSSGTGSCACAVAAHLAKTTSRQVTIELERGEMNVYWREDGVVELTGSAEIVAEGTAYVPQALPLSDGGMRG